MADLPTIWARPYHESQDRLASVTLFAFANDLLDLSSPISRARYGVPVGFDLGALEVRQHLRREAPEWFDGFFTPELLSVSKLDIGGLDGKCVDFTVAYSVQLAVAEPPNLAYLQGCWGFMMWLCEGGVSVILDEHAIRWYASEQVLELDIHRPFDVEREISVVVETDDTPGFGHVIHTRGLAKFGRPDLLLKGAAPGDAHAGGVLLNGLARRAALGAAFRENHTVGPNGLTPRALARYEPGVIHPEVNLNNDGLVLDIAGWGLRELR